MATISSKEKSLEFFMKKYVNYNNAHVKAFIDLTRNGALFIIFGDGYEQIRIPIMNEHITRSQLVWKSVCDAKGDGYGFLPASAAAVVALAEYDLVFSFQEVIKSDKLKVHGVGDFGGGMGITLLDNSRRVGDKILADHFDNRTYKSMESLRAPAVGAFRSSTSSMNYYLHALCDLAHFNATGKVNHILP